MQINFGPYNVRTHELDNKLSVQVTSDLGEVSIQGEETRPRDFPNEVSFHINNPSEEIQSKGLRRYSFGEYSFILGINNSGELFLFHSIKLYIGKKIIDGRDTLTLSFLSEPKA